MIWIDIGIITTAIAGFLLTRYIANKKHDENHMVCPIGSNCHGIVNGRFSRFLGIPIEKIGSVYYALMAVVYVASLFRGLPHWILLAGLLLSGIAFAFSVYLMIIQLLVLRKWCTLCLGSAALSFMIVVLVFLGFESVYLEFAYTSRDLLKWLYTVGVLVGTIVTTLHARTFVRFLRDFVISKPEERRLTMLSQTAWVAIGLSFLSGLGLVITDRYREFIDSDAFPVMVVIIGIIIAYEVVVNMVLSPRLIDIHFGDDSNVDDERHRFLRRFAFGMIGAGVSSWYVLLLLSTFDWFRYTSFTLFISYVVIVALAVLVTSLVETIIYRKSLRRQHTSEGEE